jgi:hypothetical protein
MTFTAILILNAVLDLAIVGALTFTMSRAAKLEPHVSRGAGATHSARQRRRVRTLGGLRPSPALD